MTRNTADIAAGAIFMLIALVVGIQSQQYEIGTVFQMGPGFFPLAVSILLFLMGALIALKGWTTSGRSLGPVSPRALVLVLLAPVVFALTVGGLGLIPAGTLVVLMGAFASRTMTLRRALLTVVALMTLSAAIFLWTLELPIAAFGPWIGMG